MHDGHIAVPDFNIQLANRILLVETTSAPLTRTNDPKERQRQIVMEATAKTNDYAWMFLYLQHCVSPTGIALIQSSLDLLVSGLPSINVQDKLDDYSHNCQKIPPFRKVDWHALRKEVFGHDHLPAVTFWND